MLSAEKDWIQMRVELASDYGVERCYMNIDW